MQRNVRCTLQIEGRRGTIRLEGLHKTEMRWMADALLDLFVIDDAYYDKFTDALCIQNWNDRLDESAVQDALRELCREKEYILDSNTESSTDD